MPTKEVIAACLASHVLGRFSAVGSDPNELSNKVLRWHEVEFDESESVWEIARALRRMGVAVLGAGLDRATSDVLHETKRDPLHMVQMGRAASPAVVGHIYPTDILGLVQPARALAPNNSSLPMGLRWADAHLHSGASISSAALLDMASQSGQPVNEELRSMSAVDPSGDLYSIGVLFAGIVTFVRSLTGELGKAIRLDAEAYSALTDGTFWSRVRLTALSNATPSALLPTPTIDIAPLRWDALTACAADARLEFPSCAYLIAQLLENTLEDPTETSIANCLGLLSALFLLNGYLRSEHAEGLSSFVTRFDRMRGFRKSLLPEARAALVAQSADTVFSADSVVAAEFRKSFCVKRRASGEPELRASLAEHFLGFSESLEMRRVPRRAAMPVTYLRTPPPTPIARGLTALHNYSEVWWLTEALGNVMESDRSFAELTTSVDVVGDELMTPNWVFVPFLARVREHESIQLSATCHAGESFQTLLSGLRSVGELLLPTRVVSRIGHGLVLAELPADLIVGDRVIETDARGALEDVCWLISIGFHTAETERLGDQILLATGMRLQGLELQHFVAAWQARRTLSGWVAYDIGASLGDPPLTYLESVPPLLKTDPVHRAFLILTYRGRSAGFDLLDRPLPSKCARSHEEFTRRHADQIRQLLLDVIKSEGVVLESCPTSNMRLAGLPSAKYLPIKDWLRRGIAVSLNSDDPTVFGVTVDAEAAMLVDVLTPEELGALSATSLANCCQGGAPFSPKALASFGDRFGEAGEAGEAGEKG